MIRNLTVLATIGILMSACTTSIVKSGTLGELNTVDADLQDVYLEDSLERAAQSYRRYLAQTSESKRTPEAMRRLADLQIEQVYGPKVALQVRLARGHYSTGERTQNALRAMKLID